MSPSSRVGRHRVPPLLLSFAAAGCIAGGEGNAGAAVSSQRAGCTPLGRTAPVVDSTAPTENVRAGRSYTCVLRAGSAPLRVTLVPDTATNTISRIELRRDSETTPFQTLTEGQTESPYRGAEFFSARDVDGDGYLDLLLLSEWGVTGNSYYHVWRWNAADNRFVFDSTLGTVASPTPVPGRPCVTTRAGGGHAGMIYTAGTLCLERGSWKWESTEDQEWNERAGVYLRRVRQRRGDSLVVVRVDTVRDTTNR